LHLAQNLNIFRKNPKLDSNLYQVPISLPLFAELKGLTIWWFNFFEAKGGRRAAKLPGGGGFLIPKKLRALAPCSKTDNFPKKSEIRFNSLPNPMKKDTS
jgi:hypothetical protein